MTGTPGRFQTPFDRLRRRALLASTLTLCLASTAPGAVLAQSASPLEPELSDFGLPDPLSMASGERVTTPRQWGARRAEILRLFEQEVYGSTPPPPAEVGFEVLAEEKTLEGRALRRRLKVFLTGDRDGPTLELLLYLPIAFDTPVATFVGLNFRGNHTIEDDPRIPISEQWLLDRWQELDRWVREHRKPV